MFGFILPLFHGGSVCVARAFWWWVMGDGVDEAFNFVEKADLSFVFVIMYLVERIDNTYA